MTHSRYRTNSLLIVATLLACCLTIAASPKEKAGTATPQSSAALPGPTGAQYVGADTCKTCHEAIFNGVETTAHGQLLTAKKAMDQPAHGCESCHGPGSAHVEGGGDKTKIFTFKDVTAKEVSARCLSCHAGSHPNFQRSAHYQAEVSCTSCHSPHHAKEQIGLLKQKSPLLCYQCHVDTKADFNRPFHHTVNEGLILCKDCHNVHDSYPKAARLSSAQDQICLKCHTEKRGPWVFEHLPVKAEGCTSCHVPHGSNNERLLTRNNVNNMCLECHGLSTFPTLHNQANKYTACTMCHAAIHGSNTSNIFFR